MVPGSGPGVRAVIATAARGRAAPTPDLALRLVKARTSLCSAHRLQRPDERGGRGLLLLGVARHAWSASRPQSGLPAVEHISCFLLLLGMIQT